MSPSVIFAACLAQPEFQTSDAVAAAALARRGVDVAPAAWNGPQAAFDAAALTIVRSTWDYMHAPAEFRGWINARIGRRDVLNAPALMRWNLSKRYLAALERRGAPTPPTLFVAPNAADIAAALARLGVAEAVVKRIESGGGIGQTRVFAEDPASFETAAEALLDGGGAHSGAGLVQPLIPEILDPGETSFIFFDGAFSHAVLKTPKSGEILCQEEYGGVTRRIDPAGGSIDEAARILSTALSAAGVDEPALYARVDGVVLDDRFILMEVELIEPDLFFNYAPDAADVFAASVLERLERLEA